MPVIVDTSLEVMHVAQISGLGRWWGLSLGKCGGASSCHCWGPNLELLNCIWIWGLKEDMMMHPDELFFPFSFFFLSDICACHVLVFVTGSM